MLYAAGCERWVRPDALNVEDAEPRNGDCHLLNLDRAASTEELRDALSAVAEGPTAVALVNSGLDTLPVGRLVDAITGSGLQAVATIPVEDSQVEVILVLCRSETLAPIWPFLSPRTPLTLDALALRRLVNEYIVEGAARRSRELLDAAERDTLGEELESARAEGEHERARAIAAEREATRLAAQIDNLKASRTYEVGKAFADVRQSPFSGLIALPGRVRRAGSGRQGR